MKLLFNKKFFVSDVKDGWCWRLVIVVVIIYVVVGGTILVVGNDGGGCNDGVG